MSAERAMNVVSAISKGRGLPSKVPCKREMYEEIYRRYVEESSTCPEAKPVDIVTRIVASPAPKFYLTPSSANIIIGKILRQWYRKRSQRHSL